MSCSASEGMYGASGGEDPDLFVAVLLLGLGRLFGGAPAGSRPSRRSGPRDTGALPPVAAWVKEIIRYFY